MLCLKSQNIQQRKVDVFTKAFVSTFLFLPGLMFYADIYRYLHESCVCLYVVQVVYLCFLYKTVLARETEKGCTALLTQGQKGASEHKRPFMETCLPLLKTTASFSRMVRLSEEKPCWFKELQIGVICMLPKPCPVTKG